MIRLAIAFILLALAAPAWAEIIVTPGGDLTVTPWPACKDKSGCILLARPTTGPLCLTETWLPKAGDLAGQPYPPDHISPPEAFSAGQRYQAMSPGVIVRERVASNGMMVDVFDWGEQPPPKINVLQVWNVRDRAMPIKMAEMYPCQHGNPLQ